MIEFRFTVRPGQGAACGFDLGDVLCRGEAGCCSSAGAVPDQGMVIVLSVPSMLESVLELATGRLSSVRFAGIDSSFALDLRRHRDTVRVSGRSGPVGTASPTGVARAMLRAAEEFNELTVRHLPLDDAGAADFTAALAAYRQAARTQGFGG